MSTLLIEVRTSPIEGKGTFALRKIPKGTRLIEYKGKRRKWSEFEGHADHYAFLFDEQRGQSYDLMFSSPPPFSFIHFEHHGHAPVRMSRMRKVKP